LHQTTFCIPVASDVIDVLNYIKTINMNSLKAISIVLISLIFASCNKEDNKDTVTGDAIIVCKKSGTNDVYGISMYTYTNSSFKSVTAISTAEPDKTYTLKANQGYKSNFYYDSPDSLFTTQKPVASTINFSAIFENGSTAEFQDELSNKVLAPAVIDTCQYSSTKKALRLIWKPVAGAGSYAIIISDGTTQVFSSPELSTTYNAVWISSNSGGWANGYSPIAGKTYKVKIFAYLYEAEMTAYNLQCVSIGESDTVWGEYK
jgi:hypothetical protein